MNFLKQRMTKAMLISVAFGTIATAGTGTAVAASTADAVVNTNSAAVTLERHQPSPYDIQMTGSLTATASPKAEVVSPAGVAMAYYNGEVNAYSVRLRTAPWIPSGIIGYYNRYMQLTIQCSAPWSSGEDWYRVQIAQTGNDGPVGFMARRFINQWVAGPFPRCAGY